jgi:hypothetical protein
LTSEPVTLSRLKVTYQTPYNENTEIEAQPCPGYALLSP